MENNVPPGLVLGSFEMTVLRTLLLSLLDVIAYLRNIELRSERFALGEAVGVTIANNLTDGGLEYHDEFERIAAMIPWRLNRAVENITDSLREMEGDARRTMFGAIMRILYDVVTEVLER